MFHREFFLLGRRLAVTGSAWLKTQSVIFLMTSSLSMLGLLLIEIHIIFWAESESVFWMPCRFGRGRRWCRGVSFIICGSGGHALILSSDCICFAILREFTEAHL